MPSDEAGRLQLLESSASPLRLYHHTATYNSSLRFAVTRTLSSAPEPVALEITSPLTLSPILPSSQSHCLGYEIHQTLPLSHTNPPKSQSRKQLRLPKISPKQRLIPPVWSLSHERVKMFLQSECAADRASDIQFSTSITKASRKHTNHVCKCAHHADANQHIRDSVLHTQGVRPHFSYILDVSERKTNDIYRLSKRVLKRVESLPSCHFQQQ